MGLRAAGMRYSLIASLLWMKQGMMEIFLCAKVNGK